MRAPILLSFIALILGAAPACAEVVALEASLTAFDSPHKNVESGRAQLTFDSATNQLQYSIRFSGLNEAASAAEIRGPARSDGKAPVIVRFYVPDSPISGTATLSPGEASALLAGHCYVEIDTATHPQGELLGPIHR